jgi:hypothetical protein
MPVLTISGDEVFTFDAPLPDGSVLRIKGTRTPPPSGPAPGQPAPARDPNRVVAAGHTWPLTVLDPVRGPDRDYPGGRGDGDLAVYRSGRTAVVEANQWGAVAVVDSTGAVVETVADQAGTWQVPVGGFVLSGHGPGSAAVRMLQVGDRVTLTYSDEPVEAPPSTPKPGGGSSGSRQGNIAVWAMLWPNSPHFDWAAIPDEVDEVRLSFLVGAGKLVGYGPWGKHGLQAGMRGFLTKRPTRFISWALGGGGQTVSVPSVDAYVASVRAVERDLFTLDDGTVFGQFGGGNVDWENRAFRASGNAIAGVLRIFKNERPGFHCSWSPNSSFRDDYVAVCRENLDVVDALGYQCYDIAGLTYTGGVRPNVQDVYRDKFAGIPAEKLEVAMMIEPGRNDRWTLSQCVDAATRLRAEFGVTQTSFWEAGMAAFRGWAAAMRKVNPR